MKEEKNEFHLLDSLFEPIAVINKQFEIIYYNHYFSTFSKASPRVIKNAKTLLDIIHIDQTLIKDLIQKSHKYSHTERSKEIEVSQTTSPEHDSYHVVLKVIPLKNEKTLICFNDLSVEKMLHEKYRVQLNELKNAHGHIIQADKMATLGELSASISHEINNPLAIAIGNCEILENVFEDEDNLKSNELIDKSFSNVSEALQRIKDIIINMKSFAHKSEERKQYHDLISIINKSISLVASPFQGQNVEIKFQPTGTNFITLSNRVEMEQVMVNLLKNGLDAICSEKKRKPGLIEIILQNNKEDECLEILIKDNGPGIPNDIQKEIFTPFFTTKDISHGTGLGLSVTNKIIEKHHGKISIYKSNSEGTTFLIKLPLLEVSSYVASKNCLYKISDDSQKKILVVDDEAKILNILNSFLMEEGHMMIGSTDPVEALEMMEKLQVDLIITDYSMPDMNGSEFSKKVRKKYKDIPIVYLTSPEFIDQFNEDRENYNIAALILKPFNKEDVSAVIRQLLKEEK